jgi:Trk K+ transport system NAD-binding subunit
LNKMGVNAIYGDVDDSEFLEDLQLHKSQMIVSTIPERETNSLILDVLKRNKAKTTAILTARQIEDALDLYRVGADYVILPHFLGGEYTSKLIEKNKDNKEMYKSEKDKEIKSLRERLKQGHQHPRVGKR